MIMILKSKWSEQPSNNDVCILTDIFKNKATTFIITVVVVTVFFHCNPLSSSIVIVHHPERKRIKNELAVNLVVHSVTYWFVVVVIHQHCPSSSSIVVIHHPEWKELRMTIGNNYSSRWRHTTRKLPFSASCSSFNILLIVVVVIHHPSSIVHCWNPQSPSETC